MTFFKARAWISFKITLIILTALLVIICYVRSTENYQKFTTQNEVYTQLIAHSSETYFNQLELILELLGEQLLKDNSYQDITKFNELFNNLLAVHKDIGIYVISDPQGNILVSNPPIPQNKPLNLLEQPVIRIEFSTIKRAFSFIINQSKRHQEVILPRIVGNYKDA